MSTTYMSNMAEILFLMCFQLYWMVQFKMKAERFRGGFILQFEDIDANV